MRAGDLRRASVVPLLLFLGLVAAWDRGTEAPVRPLLVEGHAADVLLEHRRIVRPPASHGNRFLTGWSPEVEDGTLRLVPAAAGTRLELVHLAARPRRLGLDLLAAPAGGFVRVRHAGRDLGRFPLADPLEIPLPADLPLGRVALELAWELPDGAAPPRVVAAGVRPVLATGGIRREGTDLRQRADSLVDFARPVAGGETLVGSFRPPWLPRAGQRYELRLERERGEVAGRFEWTPSWIDFFRGARAFALPVGPEPGFVRIRLVARGAGPPAWWRGLALRPAAAPATEPAAAAVTAAPAASSRPAPPRLVVVYVLDALRADRVGHLGGPPDLSPTLDRLAAAGRSYHLHRSIAPNTLPSTKALFTGRAPLAGGDLPLAPEEGPTLAERFRAAGYRTGLFSGNVFVGRAFRMDRGFEHVAKEVLLDIGGPRSPRFNDNAARVHAAALAWLRALPPGAPAFLYLHLVHPHNPYDPPAPFRVRFAGGARSPLGSTQALLAMRSGERSLGPRDVRHLRGLYDGGLAYGDAELAAFLRAVGERMPAEETLVALTSDHGEELLEHGGVLHGYTLYEEVLRIPAVLWGPGRVAPEAIVAPTSTLDFRHALLEAAGMAAPEPVAAGKAAVADGAPAVHLAAAASIPGGIFSAQTARWKVVWAPRRGAMWGMGEGIGRTRDAEYLFDLARDPREMVNLAGAPDAPLEALWLRQRLLGWVKAEGGNAPRDPALDAETRRRLHALGYLR